MQVELTLPDGGVRISITSVCNMNCFYCHNEGQPKKGGKFLTFEEFKEIVDLSMKFNLRNITLSGGEPLLNKDFDRMIAYCSACGLNEIGVCTNGILIPEHLEALAARGVNLAIGIDTCELDEISKQSKSGVKFSEIEKTLRVLKKLGIRHSINTVYTIGNKSAVLKICRYCLENDVDLRIIEMDTFQHLTDDIVTEEFGKIINEIVAEHGLTKRVLPVGKGLLGTRETGASVRFYDAYCHNRDCLNCGRWTLRIDARGVAIPCYAKDLKIPLLGMSKEEQERNFGIAIRNLGRSPEVEAVL